MNASTTKLAFEVVEFGVRVCSSIIIIVYEEYEEE